MPQTVVFDLDGTLVDTSGDLIAAANACFVGIGTGKPLDPEADRITAFHGGRAMLRLGFERLDRPWDEGDIDALYPGLLDHYACHIDVFSTIYPGAVAAIDRLLARGARLGICTNKPAALADELLRRLGLLDRFHAMLGADSLAVRKPDPEHLIQTILRAGGHVDNAVLIGDTMNDVTAARGAGVPCVLVAFGPEGRAVAKMRPDGLLDSYDALDDVLGGLAAKRLDAR